MRPRRGILVVTPDERLQSRLRMILETRGYRAVAVSYLHQATEAIASLKDLRIVIISSLVADQEQLNELRNQYTELAVIELTHPTMERDWTRADWKMKADWKPIEVLEAVRILAQRKTGPKKHAQCVSIEVLRTGTRG